MRNRAAVLYAPHDVRMEERPMPQAGPKDVLVEVKAVGVCGSDVHYYEHGRIGPYIVRQPLILGHESAGVIVAVGADVHQSRIGERVSNEEGALIEPLSVGLWACRKARLRGGDHVLITGAGPVGMLAMKVAYALGVAVVTITDVSPQRLERARQLGATHTINVAEQPLAQAGVQA